jgi:sulfopyruvate decarboxylase subunit beta
MLRIDALSAVYDDIADCAVVTIMGAVAAELYSLGHRPNFFYLSTPWGWPRPWDWGSPWLSPIGAWW